MNRFEQTSFMLKMFTQRLEQSPELCKKLLPHCRLKPGQLWHDPERKHIIGCGDATNAKFIKKLFGTTQKAKLAVHDPPYNLVFGNTLPVIEFIEWCKRWIELTYKVLDKDGALYVWLGADQNNHFQPLPEFMQMMSKTDFKSRSFITMRNQRGYGTQKNWMAVRQELLYYSKGEPEFLTQYTDIPKILRGYYKEISGQTTENIERSKSQNIRPGNVWVDIQQVFYRMVENVNGCFAQKPLKVLKRIVEASSSQKDIVADFFAHSGTTIVACEMLNRRCVTFDINPIFAEITIRRLEHYRKTGKIGWQFGHPFEYELKGLKQSETLTNESSVSASV